jgi:nucleoid DNA-binding protein
VTNLSKREIAQRVNERFNVPLVAAVAIVDEVFRYIVEELGTGRGVELRDYAVFRVVKQKARVGRNPKIPDIDVTIPAGHRVKLTPGRLMREAMERLTKKNEE